MAQVVRSANMISATGRRPVIAAQTKKPTIADSLIGVARIWSGKRSGRPVVVPQTASMVMSSPSTNTLESRSISSNSASRIASRKLSGSLASRVVVASAVDVIECLLGIDGRKGLGLGARRGDRGRGLALDRVELLGVRAELLKACPIASDRVALAPGGDLGAVTVPALVRPPWWSRSR